MVLPSRLSVLALVVCPFLAAACGSDESPRAVAPPESVSEISGSVIGGAVSFSSAASASALFAGSERKPYSFSLIPSAEAGGGICPSLAQATCSGSTITLQYNLCQLSAASPRVKWNGSEQLNFTLGACTNAPETSRVTFIRAFPGGLTKSNSNGRTVSLDTTQPSGWQTLNAGGGATIAIEPGAHTRSIHINGIHMIATDLVRKSASSGKRSLKTTVAWDETVSTPQPFVYDDAKHVISNGSLTVQHNSEKYTGIVTIAAPLRFVPGKCNPVAGTIVTTLSGSRTGTETLVYLGNDQADLQDAQGNHRTVSLTHCL